MDNFVKKLTSNLFKKVTKVCRTYSPVLAKLTNQLIRFALRKVKDLVNASLFSTRTPRLLFTLVAKYAVKRVLHRFVFRFYVRLGLTLDRFWLLVLVLEIINFVFWHSLITIVFLPITTTIWWSGTITVLTLLFLVVFIFLSIVSPPLFFFGFHQF